MAQTRVTYPSYAEVSQCHNTTEGQKLLKQNGDKTDSLEPQHNFIPWITFEGVRTIVYNICTYAYVQCISTLQVYC